MSILEWKKDAFQCLQAIEARASLYSHQKDINDIEKPSIFYTIAEKRLSIDEVITDLKNNLAANFPPGEYSNQIAANVIGLLEKSKSKISSMSSLFVALETNWGCIDEKYSREKFYDHYHPPRGDKSEISTLSYFMPIHLETDVKEAFHYCDLSKLNLSGKPFRYWRENNPAYIAKDFAFLSQSTQKQDWSKIDFPKEGALEIAFDSFYNLHNLSDLSSNIFLTIVINDVEMIDRLNKGEIRYHYFSV